MFENEEELKIARLIVQSVGAGCALIGLLAGRMSPLDENPRGMVNAAWQRGDAMAAEFMERALKVKKENEDGGK